MTHETQTPARRSSQTSLRERYQRVRQFTMRICETLSAEDCVVQSMPDASPAIWHLAHTTWFFETMVLLKTKNYQPYNKEFAYLYNSYYNSLGPQYARHRRGLITRPGLGEVVAYRQHVDRHLLEALNEMKLNEMKLDEMKLDEMQLDEMKLNEQQEQAEYSPRLVLETGLHHEQQHQELMLTDIKHVLSHNPLEPVYRQAESPGCAREEPLTWIDFNQGVYEIGSSGDGFCYDNETPRHRQYVHAFALASRPTTAGEMMAFIEAGGYQRPEYWLSAGWSQVCEQGWNAPLYWMRRDDGWWQFTLAGIRQIDPREPLCHISYLEAEAYARWAGARLPTEAEWEVAAEGVPLAGNFADTLLSENAPLHPAAAPRGDAPLRRLFGDVWEWTASPYTAYPGYRPPPGALGEYNGKFMCNQYVLRGGSCGTSSDHIRRTYRNFFPPEARWQFSGFRLAR